MIVVDASAMVEALLAGGRAADRISDAELHAPHLLDTEVTSAIRGRSTLAGHVDAELGSEALPVLMQPDMERHAHTGLLPRAWELREPHRVRRPVRGPRRQLPEEVDLDVDTVDQRLSCLVEHGNLARSLREIEAPSIREYLSTRARYQLTQRGELVHPAGRAAAQHHRRGRPEGRDGQPRATRSVRIWNGRRTTSTADPPPAAPASPAA